MGITIPYTFSQSVYLVNDPEQREYIICRMIVAPNNLIFLEVRSPDGEIMEFSELEVTTFFDSEKDAEYRKREE